MIEIGYLNAVFATFELYIFGKISNFFCQLAGNGVFRHFLRAELPFLRELFDWASAFIREVFGNRLTLD